MKTKRFTLVSILIISLVVPLIVVYNSNAATAATITATVDNNPTSIGQTFIASINIAGSQNLWAWNVNVTWNPAILNATKVAKGPFLTSNGDSDAFMSGTIDNPNGTIKGGPSQTLLTTGSVSGDGVLAKITFIVVGSGASDISLNNIRLLDPTTPTHQDEPFSLGQTLTVNIPSSNPTPAPTGAPSPTPSPTSPPTSQGQAAIHVFTNQKSYNPGDLVAVFANVTYNGAAVASKDVAFTIRMQNNTDVGTLVNRTDSTGLATITFRVPKPEPAPDIIFGKWSIIASVDVAQVNVTDTANFNVGYTVTVASISVPSSVNKLGNLPITVTLPNSGNLTSGLTVTMSLLDSAQVPIGTTMVTINSQTQGNITVTGNILIPSWAFSGQASIYVNVLTATPDQGGVPVCPEGTATVQIA